MDKLTDTVTLKNGYSIPCIGFGTWKIPEGKPAQEAVGKALQIGYRHIDTAASYHNEKSVGIALKNSGIAREEVFITSKLWNTQHSYEKVLKAFQVSLDKLGLDYLDLYLIHWPSAQGPREEWSRINADTWKAFEKLYKEGFIKAIGVSNFKIHHLDALLEKAEIAPLVDQIEVHPGFMQTEVRDYCKQHDIVVEAWSPLGSGRLLKNEQLARIASHYGCSVAQLCIRWCLQNQTIPLPKSVTPQRIVENAEVFGFEINNADMEALNSMPTTGFSGLDPDHYER